MEGKVIWITGLSGSGKTTVAKALKQGFTEYGIIPILLDGDVLRDILKDDDVKSGSYRRKDRIKLSHKYSQLCKNLSSQGFTVIIATVSMFDEIYIWNRKNLTNYFEVYLNVPMKELIKRDPKNIYKNFYLGTISDVAGLDLKVDYPSKADLVVDFKSGHTPNKIADIIIKNFDLEDEK